MAQAGLGTQARQTVPAAQTAPAAQTELVSNVTGNNVAENASSSFKQQSIGDVTVKADRQEPTFPVATLKTAAEPTAKAPPAESATALPLFATPPAAPATSEQKQPPAQANARKPIAAPVAVPATASAPAAKQKGSSAMLYFLNSAALVQNRGYRVAPIPPAVEAIATQAQELLFVVTGMLFHDVAFQVPSDEDEDLAVMRGFVANLDQPSQNGKLYYLSWDHLQFFQAEMAEIGYKFVTAKVREAGPANKTPVCSWLTLRLITKVLAAEASRASTGAPEGHLSAKRRKAIADDSRNRTGVQADAQGTTAAEVAAAALLARKNNGAPEGKRNAQGHQIMTEDRRNGTGAPANTQMTVSTLGKRMNRGAPEGRPSAKRR